VLVIVGFAFRVTGLSSEGLSEDELNKLNAAADYRAHGLTAANGEHPLLMKALITTSLIAAEKWNQTSLVLSRPGFNVSVETALRLPVAIFGALTVVLIYLVAAELFGLEAALIAAALWAFDPLAIGLNRIGKEDTFLVFFFLLANVFWLRSQRVAESQPHRRPDRYYWATAASFGAMLASKYMPQMIVIPFCYNYMFQEIPETRWRIGRKRYLKIFIVMGVVFLLLNPTILLPDTWRAMAKFASYKMMGHDSYEFMGRLYNHRGIDWLRGVPWYHYFVLMGVKLPVLTLFGFAVGSVLLFRRQTGDGRYLILIWMFFWGLTFVPSGGKFVRYFTSAMPAVIITAAIGVQAAGRWLGRWGARVFGDDGLRVYARSALASLVIISAFWSSASAFPHYRLYMNALGGGPERAGAYFPQDEFYDAYIEDSMKEIAVRARPGARIASELPTVAAYYAQRVNRPDLVCLELSDPSAIQALAVGDFVIDARGRTYFSNEALLLRLRQASQPAFGVAVGATHAAHIYILDQRALNALRAEPLK
jgi:hypothetical protein